MAALLGRGGGKRLVSMRPRSIITHSWDSSAAAPSAMQTNLYLLCGKGTLCHQHDGRLVQYLNARKPGMICRMAGEGHDRTSGRQASKGQFPFPFPFPSLPSKDNQLPSPTQNPTQTIPLPSTTLTVPTTIMQAASAGAKPNPRPPPCMLQAG